MVSEEKSTSRLYSGATTDKSVYSGIAERRHTAREVRACGTECLWRVWERGDFNLPAIRVLPALVEVEDGRDLSSVLRSRVEVIGEAPSARLDRQELSHTFHPQESSGVR